MAETLHRIEYDATIDDAVDVAFRLAGRSEACRKQVRLNVIIAGVLGGSGFLGVWVYDRSLPVGFELAVAAAGTVVFGVIFARLFRYLFYKEMHKQHRKMVVEQFGGKPAIRSEVELRSDAIWVRQAGMELIFPWTLCTGIQDNAGDVEMNFTPGICVVRNRNFSSMAERQDFLDTARRLASPQEAR
jgi:hypothetical protein